MPDAIEIYIDEDAMDNDLVAALRSRGVPVTTAIEAGLSGQDDETQLEFASRIGCALYTCNISDFHRIHSKWVSAGRVHGGIILVPQQRYSIGEQLRRILRLRASLAPARLRNRVEFLSNWADDA